MLHDLVIRLIARYLRMHNNNNMSSRNLCKKDLVKLILLNQRFYDIRHIFIKQMCIIGCHDYIVYNYHNTATSNPGFSLVLFHCSIIGDSTTLGHCHYMKIKNCRKIGDIFLLGISNSYDLFRCGEIALSAIKVPVSHLSISHFSNNREEYCDKMSPLITTDSLELFCNHYIRGNITP